MTAPLTGLGWTSSNVPVAGWIPAIYGGNLEAATGLECDDRIVDGSIQPLQENSFEVIALSTTATCPAQFSLFIFCIHLRSDQWITTTVEGAPANFGKGFAQKYGYYLCFTVSVDALNPTGDVLYDVVILSEKSPLPSGYAYAKEFLDLKTSVSKKKRLCFKLIPMGVAETAVCDIMLSSKSKVIPNYIRVGEISGFALWCKKEHINKPRPFPKPRSISLEMNQLSLETANVDPLSVGSKRQTTIKKNESIYDTANTCGISAIDGVPFTLHPKFENNVIHGTTALSIFKNFHIKSLADIEKEYDYSFVIERTAAARLPPTIS